jgi:hypothetical protein
MHFTLAFCRAAASRFAGQASALDQLCDPSALFWNKDALACPASERSDWCGDPCPVPEAPASGTGNYACPSKLERSESEDGAIPPFCSHFKNFCWITRSTLTPTIITSYTPRTTSWFQYTIPKSEKKEKLVKPIIAHFSLDIFKGYANISAGQRRFYWLLCRSLLLPPVQSYLSLKPRKWVGR